jgi:hypothetical protein
LNLNKRFFPKRLVQPEPISEQAQKEIDEIFRETEKELKV